MIFGTSMKNPIGSGRSFNRCTNNLLGPGFCDQVLIGFPVIDCGDREMLPGQSHG